MKNIPRSILYYPTINIPNGAWLRHSLLYWDEVSSIVPKSWEGKSLYNLSPDIRYLLDEGQFRAIKPDSLLYEQEGWEIYEDFIKEFKDVIESPSFKKICRQSEYPYSRIHGGKLNLNRESSSKTVSRIHTDKISDNLFNYLKDCGLANKGEGDWFYFERTTALIYMSLLAKYLARIDKAQTIVGTDVKSYEKLNFQKVDADKGFPVISMDLSDFLPSPRPNVPFEKIIDFKRERKDELIRFRKLLIDFQSKISKVESNEELKGFTVSFKEDIQIGVSQLSALMKESKIDTVFKSIKSLINLKSPTAITTGLTLVNEKAHLIQAPLSLKIASLSLVGAIELRGNYIDLRNKNLAKARESAFSYLLNARRTGIIM